MSKPVVAVYGVNGALGQSTLTALTSPEFSSRFQLPIVAITRNASNKTNSDFIVYKEAQLDDPASLEKALSNVDVLVNLGSANVSLDPIIEPAVKAGVKLYFPSQFGCYIPEYTKNLPILDFKTLHSNLARKLGLKTVDIATSFFAQPGSYLYEALNHIGLNSETKTVTYIGDETIPVQYSVIDDIGKVIAVLASTDPAKLPDNIRVYSGTITPEEIIQRYEKTHGVTIKREHKDAQEALKEGQNLLKTYGLRGQDVFFYLNIGQGLGPGNGVIFTENDREFINPNESLFKWSKY